MRHHHHQLLLCLLPPNVRAKRALTGNQHSIQPSEDRQQQEINTPRKFEKEKALDGAEEAWTISMGTNRLQSQEKEKNDPRESRIEIENEPRLTKMDKGNRRWNAPEATLFERIAHSSRIMVGITTSKFSRDLLQHENQNNKKFAQRKRRISRVKTNLL